MGLFQYTGPEKTEKCGAYNVQFLVKEQVMLHFWLHRTIKSLSSIYMNTICYG